LFTVFMLQGIVMWLVALPVQMGISVNATAPPSPVNYLGLMIWGVGFLCETFGDYQLARFKANTDNRGRVLDSGLWRYTRHPNYFGDALVWWGLFLTSVSTNTLWTVISPMLMNFLLVKVSGVALLERDLAQRSDEYRAYIARTSSFIPWPPKSV
jgi:steroid 5-alpha reductase family enzyme